MIGNVPRLWRTVRHLTAEQWVFRAICRGRRLAMGITPASSRRRIEGKAAKLPLPDLGAPDLIACAEIVLKLQNAVHGEFLEGIGQGQFVLLNHPYDFGTVDAIPWRGDFHEGNNPLRRMTLAYMGYAVPLLATGREDDLKIVLRLLRGLEEQNSWSEKGVFRDVWNTYTASHRLINQRGHGLDCHPGRRGRNRKSLHHLRCRS